MHVLLITRHYPPEISGGARRPALLTECLRRMGHRVTLVTPFGDPDDPDLIRVTSQPILNAQAAAHQPPSNINTPPNIKERIKNALRPWLYWPDPDIKWAKAVLAALQGKDICPDWIMTTSPPESTHLVGHILSQRLGVPWLAEFRDTWIESAHRQELLRSSLRRWGERRIARRVLKNVTAVTGVSEAIMRDIRMLTPAGTPECIIGHFSGPPEPPMDFGAPNEMHLVHTGGFSLSDHRRKLGTLLAAIEALNTPHIHLHIAGPLSPHEVSLCGETTDFKITCHGRLPLEQAKAMQSGADGLLLVTPQDSHALPGKYAEYRQARKPIYYLGGGDWLNLVTDKTGLFSLKNGLEAPGSFDPNAHIDEDVSVEAAAKALFDFMAGLANA